MSTSLRVAASVRAVWAATGLIVVGGGVGLVWWPASRHIADVRASSQELYQQANDLDEATRRAAELRSVQSRIRSDVQSLGGRRSDAAVTASLLQLLHDEGKRSEVEIRAITPDDSKRRSLAKGDVLAGYGLAVAIRGRFRNVVAFISDLSRHDVLIDVRTIDLRSAGPDTTPMFLDATVGTTIYRIAAPSDGEDHDVRTLR